MMKTTTNFAFGIFLLILVVAHSTYSSNNSSDAWSQFRGSNRDGISRSTVSIKAWGEEGPALVWKREIGPAFSGIATYGRELITSFGEDSSEYVASFNSNTGEENWRCAIDTMFTDDLGNRGPRSTPTVDGNQAFALSSNGNFVALNCENGNKIWEVDLASKYSIRVPRRGFTTSPIVLDELIGLSTAKLFSKLA